MKHKKIEVERKGSDLGIAIWYCSKCKHDFQCGDSYTTEMFCSGYNETM